MKMHGETIKIIIIIIIILLQFLSVFVDWSVAISVCVFVSASFSQSVMRQWKSWRSSRHTTVTTKVKMELSVLQIENARRGAKLRFCYTWKIEFVLSDVSGITNSRGPLSCKANKLLYILALWPACCI